MIDLRFDESEKRMINVAREVAEKKLMPLARQADEKNCFSWENYEVLKSAGLMSLTIPAIYGGSELSELACVAVKEEISRASTSAASLMENHMMASHAFLGGGSNAQKEFYLPSMASCKILGTLAITEPEAGSDVQGIQILGLRVPQGYRLKGTKRFISLADVAGIYLILAKTDPAKKHKGMTIFIVEKTNPGVSLGKKEEKMGQRALVTADVILDNCILPGSAVLGAENQGFQTIVKVLNRSRISIGAQAVGVARAAYEEALSYAQKRSAFGRLLIKHEAIAFMLADMATEIDAARLMVYKAAKLFDLKEDIVTASAMAKLFATEVSNRVVNRAVQIHGGYGFMKDYPVERYYRDQRVTELYGGTSEMMRITIARCLESKRK